MIRAIIFDLGHTLWDLGPHGDALDRAYASMHATLRSRLGRNDLPPADVFKHAVRDALRDSAESYSNNGAHLDQPPTHTWVAAACRALGIELEDSLLREITPPLFATEIDGLICADGTREALEDLARDYALGCVTNTLAGAGAIHAMLRKYDMFDVMRTVVVSSEEGYRKPHPSLFEKALRQTGAQAAETVFVGDSPLHDIGGAKRAGMRAVLTHQYAVRPHEDIDPQPDAIIRHLRELRAVVSGW